MEQKNYKLEIVSLLLREENHIRGLAEILNTNHMTVLRKVKELQKENVVDFCQKGRNKTFFLKKTAEARAYAHMAEHYKLINVLNKYPSLRSIIDKIQKNKKIELAILFGSYAKGLAAKDSDIDIYICTADRKLKNELSMADSKLSIKIGKYDRQDNLIKEIEKNHVIIKGVEKDKACLLR